MKKVYTASQLLIVLQSLYSRLNSHCFSGELPTAIITTEPGAKHHAYGWTYSRQMWDTASGSKYSIVIASEYLNQTENVTITLLHEMCHIYAMEKGIKDTSRRGYYHNDKFKEIAENAGLVCTKEKQGWATRSMTKELKAWIDEQGKQAEIKIRWNEAPKEEAPKPEDESTEGGTDQEEKPKKKSGYYVLKCPKCGAKIRATKYTLHLMCMGDGDEMHEPTVMGIER